MRSLKLLSVTALAAATGCAALAKPPEPATLSVNVDGLRNGSGAVIEAAFEAMDVANVAAMGRLGPPSKFEDAAVTTSKITAATLRLKYWN